MLHILIILCTPIPNKKLQLYQLYGERIIWSTHPPFADFITETWSCELCKFPREIMTQMEQEPIPLTPSPGLCLSATQLDLISLWLPGLCPRSLLLCPFMSTGKKQVHHLVHSTVSPTPATQIPNKSAAESPCFAQAPHSHLPGALCPASEAPSGRT